MKSDYWEFNWWNLWSYFDVMFGYENLMIIKLLMLILHAWDVYICILCDFAKKLVKYDIVVVGLLMNSWLIDVVVAMRCCCWWLMSWVFIIMKLWCELSCFWKFYEKWVNWWFVMGWCFDASFIWIWVPFYVYKRLDKLWGRIWVLGNQNWGFGVKMEFFSRAELSKLAITSN